jgi:hypothetical protein
MKHVLSECYDLLSRKETFPIYDKKQDKLIDMTCYQMCEMNQETNVNQYKTITDIEINMPCAQVC